jgi:hypothetical protein
MGRFVYITTPIPTLDEVGKSLKMSKARQQRLIEIVVSSAHRKLPVGHRVAQGEKNARMSNGNGARKLIAPSRSATKGSALNKKSKRAAAS